MHDIMVASSRNIQKSWRNRREVVNVLALLSSEENRIAQRLAQLRAAHALTQENAAARAGVTLRQWQRWESGQSEPYARNIARLSEEFSIPIEELVGVPDFNQPSQLDRIEQAITQLIAETTALRLQQATSALEVSKQLASMLPPQAQAPRRQRA